MAPPFRLLLSKDGIRTMLGRLEMQQILLGREPADGFKIPSSAVSREHGILLSFDKHWYFKDLGSSNGSWLNGRQLIPQKLNLVKVGDVLQLADSLLEIASVEPGDLDDSITSVIVFRRGDFHREFPLVEQGPIATFGGKNADIKLDEETLDLPGLVIERRGSDLTASVLSTRINVLKNEMPLERTVILKDRDVLACGAYEIFISLGNDITASREQYFKLDDEVRVEGQGAVFHDWEEESAKRAPVNPAFGRVSDKAMDLRATAVMPANSRYDVNDSDKEVRKLDAFENFIVVGVGALLLILVVGATLYWILA